MASGNPRRVAVVGGGPAGLFLARMVGLTSPGTAVEVYERNGAEDVSGFGVALSERTLTDIADHDPETHRRVIDASVTLTGAEVRLPGRAMRYDGFAMVTISRHTLLRILRDAAGQAGARLHYRHAVPPGPSGHRAAGADVVVIADGGGSRHRATRATEFGTTVHTGRARYIWLGTRARAGDVATFAFVPTPYGVMAAHMYPYSETMSTVVVETDEATWCKAGFGAGAPIDDGALAMLSGIFADHLDGHALISNNSRWDRFAVVSNKRWSAGNAVLVGDAAHTAHFTIGSGTKLALQDGLALAKALEEHDDTTTALVAYEQRRRGPVARVQQRAYTSMLWWETFARRLNLPAAQYGLHFITRAGGFTYRDLRARCGERVAEAEAAFHNAGSPGETPGTRAVAAPLRHGPLRTPDRLVRVVPDSAGAGSGHGLVLLRGAEAGVLRAEHGGGVIRFAELFCPQSADVAEEWVVQGAELALQGVTGVLLRPGPGARSWWQRTLEHASRLRTETGLVVAVCVPAGWEREAPEIPGRETWAGRIQLALITGRIDLVAPWPMSEQVAARA
ncbi:hypothetical protein GCM10010435_24620 [Winogradskya consettensis]|uniref:FAD-binding domain-containing protein n=1 Tax=Winogradskya consettensis TaxID=113560 RepID=A0A919T2J3_9ACTN|nr:FAD-dependent monooxygenase [Actinoplanes consettensis]GIM82500.1 hypothetical protein Aco04nite_81940 [Actinoplanes consettensis]